VGKSDKERIRKEEKAYGGFENSGVKQPVENWKVGVGWGKKPGEGVRKRPADIRQ